jgi:4-amino-4-deoxy-L-arabinose transferase-like glycosyltransferase
LLPFSTDLAPAFSHDSGYIAIVARNLLNGKGWVNDASWLVFLQPDHLPMPYHNANPLYPLLTAVAAKVFSIQVVPAGLLVSALADVALLIGAYFLVSYWLKNTWTALVIAVAVATFPPVWKFSLQMLPDSLTLTLLIAGLACFVRAENRLFAAAAGILFGAAWLTRSTASLMGPALAVYAFAVWRWPAALFRLSLAAAVALLVALPWLIYTAHVWGSPFRSDAPYYVFQDFFARSHGGSIHRYWRSPTPPPTPAELLRTDGAAVLTGAVTGIPKVLRAWLQAGWEDQYYPRIVFVILLVSVALISRRHLTEPPLLAAAVYVAMQIGVLSLRANSMEPRYLAPLTAFAVLCVGCGIAALPARWRPPRAAGYALYLGCAFFAVYTPLQDARLTWHTLLQEDPATANRRRIRRSIAATITHQDPVIVFDPYFFTYDTGAQALSIPDSNDAYLMRYMDRYHSRWIILSDDEVRFWKPDWQAQLPSWLRIRAVSGGNTLFERVAPS